MRAPRTPVFPRFSELTHDNVNRDFQVHTSWTDGAATVSEVLARARQVGLAEIAFTEHARATSDYYPDFFREIDEQDDGADGLTIYRGFEVKALDADGRLDMSDDMRGAADIMLGSVHALVHEDGRRGPAADFGEAEAREIELALAKGIVTGGAADVLSHAGGMCLRTFGHFPLEAMEQLVVLAARRGVAFEINISYHRDILDDLLPLLARHDPPVSIGSDAHRLDELGACRDALRECLSL